MQSFDFLFPIWSDALPGGQSLQSVALATPFADEYVPCGHASQATAAEVRFFASKFGVNGQFSQFYGGTSLLIMVGVILDTLQQIESHLLMRHYDGLMKSGRIKGRSSINMAG